MEKTNKLKRILVVAAHPDDEILGCGATIARLVQEGHEAYTLILGEGVTSRAKTRDSKKDAVKVKKLKRQIEKANKIIGIRDVFTYDFPDNRFDSIPILDIVKKIETVKNKIKPDIIFTHYKGDLNIDHQVTSKAVITATRPFGQETVKEIYSFEVLSSTEWDYPTNFSANVFFDISKTINLKKQAMAQYVDELKQYPHPRSIEGLEIFAKNRGLQVSLNYVEAYEIVRVIK